MSATTRAPQAPLSYALAVCLNAVSVEVSRVAIIRREGPVPVRGNWKIPSASLRGLEIRERGGLARLFAVARGAPADRLIVQSRDLTEVEAIKSEIEVFLARGTATA